MTWHKMGEGWSWIRKPGTEADHAADAREGWAQVKRDLAARPTASTCWTSSPTR